MAGAARSRTEPPNAEGSLPYLMGITLTAALGGLLFGYDTGVISGAIGFLEEAFQLSPRMVGWVASCALVGCMAGVAVAGWLADRFGRKRVLGLAAVLFLVSAIGTALPETLWVFILFRFSAGLGIGIASMVSPIYIAEVTPAHLRGRMVSLNQLAIISGMLLVYFINMYIETLGDHAWDLAYGWRWMFGIAALPALLLLALCLLVPESPRWLAQQGKAGEARRILTHIAGTHQAESTLKDLQLSQATSAAATFRGTGMSRVLAIGISLAVLQQVTGINAFLYFGPEIFKSFGSETSAALLQQVAVGTTNLIFTLIAIWTVDRVGRKPLMIAGASGMGICLFLQGIFAMQGVASQWLLVFVLGYIASFALSLGPVIWVYLSEIFPNRVRGRAMSISTFFLWFSCWLVSQTFPMMDKDPFLVERFNHTFPFFLYGLFCIVTVILVARWVPETKGKSLEEIEKMWS